MRKLTGRESLKQLADALPERDASLLALLGRILDLEAMSPGRASRLLVECRRKASKAWAEAAMEDRLLTKPIRGEEEP